MREDLRGQARSPRRCAHRAGGRKQGLISALRDRLTAEPAAGTDGLTAIAAQSATGGTQPGVLEAVAPRKRSALPASMSHSGLSIPVTC